MRGHGNTFTQEAYKLSMTELARVWELQVPYKHTNPYLRAPNPISEHNPNGQYAGLIHVHVTELWGYYNEYTKWELLEKLAPGSTVAWDVKFPNGNEWAHIWLIKLREKDSWLGIVDHKSETVWVYDSKISAWTSIWHVVWLEDTEKFYNESRWISQWPTI